MKKAFFVLLFIFVVMSVMAQSEIFRTSNGMYSASIEYIGRYVGQSNFNNFTDARFYSDRRRVTPSDFELDCIRRMMGLYSYRAGDTFYIALAYWPDYWNRPHPSRAYMVFTEAVDNSRFYYWVIQMPNSEIERR
jgi:hypothetical protein